MPEDSSIDIPPNLRINDPSIPLIDRVDLLEFYLEAEMSDQLDFRDPVDFLDLRPPRIPLDKLHE